MKRNAFVILICTTLILAPGSSVANPEGTGMAIETTLVGGPVMVTLL